LVGTSPRFEASALNIRLRELVLKKNLTVASIASRNDLTYPVEQLGNGMESFYQLAQGTHPKSVPGRLGTRVGPMSPHKGDPQIILGFNVLQREDGDALAQLAEWIVKR